MTYEEILNRALSRVPNSVDKREGSIIYDALAPACFELAQVYVKLDYIYSKLDAENLEGEELELFVEQRTGVGRKRATKAIRKGIFFNSKGSPFNIPIDSRFMSNDLVFKAIKKLDEGEFQLECESEGEVGNTYTEQLIPIDYISGLGLASLTEILTPGYDSESDKSLLERYYERIRTPATSGNIYHYRNWAKEVTGVGDVKIIPLWNGDNTVKVIIIDDKRLPAELGLVEKVQEYIDPQSKGLGEGKAPIGAFCTVVSAKSKNLNISFKVIKDADVTHSEMIESVKTNIERYLREQVTFKQNIVSYAKLGAILLDSKGILDYSELLLNARATSISLDTEEIPTLIEVIANE